MFLVRAQAYHTLQTTSEHECVPRLPMKNEMTRDRPFFLIFFTTLPFVHTELLYIDMSAFDSRRKDSCKQRDYRFSSVVVFFL